MADEAKKEFRSVVGVKDIHFAPYKDGIWKTPTRVQGLQELTIKNAVAEGVLMGDMKKLKSKTKKTGLDIDLTIAEWTPSIQAMLEGCFNENGELESSPDDVDQAVALLWKEVYDNGDEVYIVAYNTKIHRENAFEGKGNTDNIDFAVTKLVGTGFAVTNPNTGKPTFSFKLDTADEKVDKNKVANFFTTIQFRGQKTA